MKAGEEKGRRLWAILAIDNSIPYPKSDLETGFLPMYFNASPFIASTDEGDEALCVFSSAGEAMSYLHEAQKPSLIERSTPIPFDGREDFQKFLAVYSIDYVVVDPELSALGDRPISVEKFLAEVEG